MTLGNIIRGKTANPYIQVFRYLISGGIAFVVDFLLLYLLTDVLHVYYLTSSVISFSVGLLITYLFSIAWIFDKRRLSNPLAEFVIFAAIGVVGLALTYLFMRFFTDTVQVHYLVSKIFTTMIVFVWNFLAKRFILFSAKTNKN